MTITIAILVSIVISLGISFYFQSINKNNNTMTKVKKYADKRQEDLLALSKEIKKDFEIILSEFGAQQNQANAAIKRFNQQNEEFTTKIKTLEGSITSIHTIQTKVDSYTKILGDLNDMTKQVEENLERIHKESTIVDNLKAKLAKQQQIVDTIEKKIPEVTKKFSEQNAEQLKAVGTKLLDENKTYADKIAADIKQSQKEADMALSNIKSTIQSAYNDAAKEAESLENTAFKHLSDLAAARTAEYQKQLQDKTKQLESSLNDTFKQATDKISTSFNEKLTSIQTKYSNAFNNASAASTKKINDFNQQFVEEQKKLLEKVNSAIAEINSDTEDRISEFKSDYTQRFEAVANNNSDQIAQLNDTFSNEYNKISSHINELETLETESKQKLDILRNSIEESLRQCATRSDLLKANIDKCDEAISKAENIQPEIDSKLLAANQSIENYQNDTTKQLEVFQNEVNEKLNALSKIISDSVKKAVTESEGKHFSILEDVDNQLNAYKKDIEYKLSQIQISETDIDTLEKSLKSAMNEVQNRLLADFDKFEVSQKQKHDEFNKSLKEDSDAIEQKLALIDRNLDDLKATATGNMSSKLQEFETNYNQILSTMNKNFDSDIVEWRHNIDAKLTSLTNTYEDSRKQVESEYLESLKANITSLQEKSSDQYAKLGANIQQTQENMQSSIDSIQTVINKFMNDSNSAIGDIAKASQEELKREIEANIEMVKNSLTRSQDDLVRDLRAFEENIQAQQQTGSSSIDAALAEFNTWKQQLKGQLDDSSELFNSQLDSFQNSSKMKMEEAVQKLEQNMTTYAASIQDQHNQLNDQISTLEDKTTQSIQLYEKRADEILSQLNNMYEEMLTATEQKVREQNDDASAKIDALRNSIQTISDESKSTQSKLVLKMQDEANGLQSQFSELSKELFDIQSNIQQFEKADKMKRDLDDKIADLEKAFGKITDYTEAADKLNDNYRNLVNMNNDIDNQLSTFEAQKNKVLNMEQKYNNLIALSDTIDNRMHSMNTTKDDLLSMEVTIRNYNDKLQYISEQYERLEKKDEVVTRVISDVDTEFEKLKDLEQRLVNCDRQAVSLPQEIKAVQTNVDRILQNGPKITDAISRLENLDSLIEETEKRIDALNSVQTGIKKTELDLQGLSRDVDNKFKVLHQITKQNLSEKPMAKGSSINPRINESVRQLKRQGWSISEIAEKLKLTENEVDLILQLPE